MNKVQKLDIKLFVIIAIIVTAVLSTTYALLNFQMETTTASTQAGCFAVDYTGTVLSTSSLVSTTDYTEGAHATVTLKKNASCAIYSEATIHLHTDATNTAPLNGVKALKYKVMRGNEEISTGVVTDNSTSDSAPTDFTIDLSTVELTTTAITYDVYIWIDSNVSMGTYDNKIFSGYIYASSEQTSTIRPEISDFRDTVLAVNASSDKNIDFSKTSQETNTNGIYYVEGTQNDTNPIYYYRGNVNNNLLFADTCWKIVRTTETGGLKLIYNGTPTNGTCNNTGESTQIGTKAFNTASDTPAYAGYMYGTPYRGYYWKMWDDMTEYYYGNDVTYSNGQYTLVDTITNSYWDSIYDGGLNNNHYTCDSEIGTSCTEAQYIFYTDSLGKYYIDLPNGKKIEDALEDMLDYNTTSSSIKGNKNTEGTLDHWYYTNIKQAGYSNYLEDTVWCNDRSISSLGGWDPDGGDTTSSLYFSSYNRASVLYKPSLNCSRDIDKFTVKESNGNGDLDYPIGLLTADEVMLAGAKGGTTNSSYYLYTGQSYWNISPSAVYNSDYLGSLVASSGSLGDYTSRGTHGVRPSISLKAGYGIISGNGTTSSPYVVDTSIKPSTDNTITTKTINFYNGNGSIGTQEVDVSTDTALSSWSNLEGSVKSGYEGWTFAGWTTSNSSNKVEYKNKDVINITDNKNLYAVYSRQLNINYNSNGGIGNINSINKTIYVNSNSTTTSDQSITLANNTFTKAGHTFSKWTAGSTSGTEYTEGATYNPNLAYNATTFGITIYAKWTVETYAISYDANGGTGAPANQTKTYGIDINLSSTEPTRSGYIFLGWSTSSTATTATYQAGDIFSVNEATQLFAVWSVINYKTITFYNGTGSIGTQQVEASEETLLSSWADLGGSIRSGYKDWIFAGWATSNSSNTIEYEDSDPITISSNTNLYAVYSRVLTITYNSNGGTGTMNPTTKTIYINSNSTTTSSQSINLANNTFTKSGELFNKWAAGSTSGIEYSEGATYNPNIAYNATNFGTTMYAKWSTGNYMINYNSNFGLPSGYKILSYIESSGTQYINTEYNASNTTKFVLDYEYLSGDNDWVPILGQRVTLNSNMFAIWVNQSHKGVALNYGTTDTSTINGTNGSGRHVYKKDYNNFYIDGNLLSTVHTDAFTTEYPLIIFGLNSTNQAVETRNSSGRLYSFKIYDNVTLVRDFIPCINPSGIVGLYDLVNSQFYENEGTGNFVTSEAYVTTGNPNSTVNLPSPSRPGYTFGGWYEDSSFTGSAVTTIPAKNTTNKTYYAKWTANTYNVTYAMSDLIYGRGDKGSTTSGGLTYSIASNVVTATASQDDSFALLPPYMVNLTAGKSYIFDMESNGTYGFDGDTVEAYFNLNCNFSDNTWYQMLSNNNYTFTPTVSGTYCLRLDVNQSGKTYTFSNIRVSEVLSTGTITYGSTYASSMPSNPSKTGYTFVGWYDDAHINAPLNYYAGNYKDLYDAYGYNANNLFAHYTQMGQGEGRRISQYESTDPINVPGDKIIYGYIKDANAPTVPTYTAYYADGSGNYTSGNIAIKQVNTTISSTDDGIGVAYMQYSTDKNTWNTFSFSAGSMTKSGTTWSGIEPWTFKDRNDTFYFRACDATGNCSGASAAFNIRYVSPKTLDVNHTLDGSSMANSTDSGVGSFDVYISGTQTSNDIGDYYTAHNYGTTYQIKDIKAKTGYTYAGSSSYSGTITQATSVVLAWTTNTYTVTYNANGGSGAPAAFSYKYATSGYTNLSSTRPTRNGYCFLGWSLQSNATSPSYSPGQVWYHSNASNYTLYAVWKPVASAWAITGLKFTGASQTGVSGAGVTWGGTTAATNPGSYTATATPASGYVWEDGTSSAKNIGWSIAGYSFTVGSTFTMSAGGSGYFNSSSKACKNGTKETTFTSSTGYYSVVSKFYNSAGTTSYTSGTYSYSQANSYAIYVANVKNSSGSSVYGSGYFRLDQVIKK